jgi:hypothetical protein
MKTKHFIPILFLLIIGCEKGKIAEIAEMPDDISILKPFPGLVDSLCVYFPENENTFLAYPDLFSDAAEKNMVLTKESEVYVTFMCEGAGYRNSLCWYTYNKYFPVPLKATDIKGNVLFPNISEKGEGGQLESGYTVQLGTGKFPIGTVIDFFLVQNGWEDGTIDYSHPTFYTDYGLDIGGKQQHILFKDSYYEYILLGFEDIEFDDEICDKDFNDIIFAITDNKEGYEATSFDLSKVIKK